MCVCVCVWGGGGGGGGGGGACWNHKIGPPLKLVNLIHTFELLFNVQLLNSLVAKAVIKYDWWSVTARGVVNIGWASWLLGVWSNTAGVDWLVSRGMVSYTHLNCLLRVWPCIKLDTSSDQQLHVYISWYDLVAVDCRKLCSSSCRIRFWDKSCDWDLLCSRGV